jgi:hypothetical protein
MPTYSWIDEEHHWLVFTSISTRNDPQACPKCGKDGTRAPWMDAHNVDKEAAGSWNQQSFNPGLGCWTNSTKHAEQIAASRGLEPIGNEPPENLHKMAEKTKAETREQRWRDADRQMLYD